MEWCIRGTNAEVLIANKQVGTKVTIESHFQISRLQSTISRTRHIVTHITQFTSFVSTFFNAFPAWIAPNSDERSETCALTSAVAARTGGFGGRDFA